MRGLLVFASLLCWFILMVWVYRNTPEWFFVPFFFVSTFAYLRLMEPRKSS